MTTTIDEYRALNIVILGASFAGISAAHHIFHRAIPELRKHSKIFSYRISVVSPSKCMFYNISAARALVPTNLIPHEQSFIPFEECFQEFDPRYFEFIQGTANDLDTKTCSITVRYPVHEVAIGTGTERESRARQRHEELQDKLKSTAQRNSYSKYPDDMNLPPSTSKSEVKTQSYAERTIKYHALIIATGSTANCPLLSLRGPHENTRLAIDGFRSRLTKADIIIVAGGGPSGVEVAGQIAYWCKKGGGLKDVRMSKFSSFGHLRTSTSKGKTRKVILVCGSSRLLPDLDKKLGIQAQRQLEQLGVKILIGIRVEGTEAELDKITVKLDNGTHLSCDCYVPCTGVLPNTQFLSIDSPLLRDGFMVTANNGDGESTLRVKIPGDNLPDNAIRVVRRISNEVSEASNIALPRVYAIGDCSDYSKQCIEDVYAPMEVLVQNFILDLRAYQLAISNPYGGNQEAILELFERSLVYPSDHRSTQIVPIGALRPGGVGTLNGKTLPSLLVYFLKGRDYTIGRAREVVRQGISPYPTENQVKRMEQRLAK